MAEGQRRLVIVDLNASICGTVGYCPNLPLACGFLRAGLDLLWLPARCQHAASD